MTRTILSITLIALFTSTWTLTASIQQPPQSLIKNPDFHQQTQNYQLTGDVEYRYLGDPHRDASVYGISFEPAKNSNSQGSISQTINIDSSAGRSFHFTFRGLAQDNFAVTNDDLYMKVEYFTDNGKKSLDGKVKKIYSQIEQDRRDLSVNGDHRVGGAAVWRTYQMDFWLPFPQIDTLRLSVGFDHGSARRPTNSEFFLTDFNLTQTDSPELLTTAADLTVPSQSNLLSLGGRWFYKPNSGETQAPHHFDSTNADRLLYHDTQYTTPFAGAMTAWLRAGDKDPDGNIVTQDQFIPDNVTLDFDSSTLTIHTRGIPNHPTGKFPEPGHGNPNYIQEHARTYYIPLNPQVNPKHFVTTTNNSNHALPMGPIGIAANGIVFFNPFDMGNTDATNMMDRCCGHPNQDGMYHYHKYPICLNSPWSDEGTDHSPLIGFAFDGFPIYGPYEKANTLAKDLTGENALNAFNLHYDKDRGYHYHVTPGKFPYIIGGYWGTEDSHDTHHGPPGGGPPNGQRHNGPPPGNFAGGPPPGARGPE